MYRKGDVQAKDQMRDEQGYAERPRYDSREDGMPKVPVGHVYLPHSCDEWAIGGIEQIQTLISDLERLIDKKKVTE